MEKKVLITVSVFLVAFALTSCFMINEQDSAGGLSLNATLPDRGLYDPTGLEDQDVWVVGFLVEESFGELLKDVVWLEDCRIAQIASQQVAISRNDIVEGWKNLADGAVRFDGGRPYFQFSMDRVTGTTGTGNFTIEGIPAGKSYYIYLLVMEERIESLDDLSTVPVASSALHFVDSDEMNAGNFNSPDGWYYFTTWDLLFSNGLYELNSYSLWLMPNRVPYSAGAFSVGQGETAAVSILLADRQ